MIQRYRKYVLAVLVFAGTVLAQAQSVEFLAKVNKNTVAADEAFKLTYSVNVQADFTAPDLRDFKLLSGPSSSSYTQVQIINGQMRNSVSLSWTMIARPRKEGEFVIPPASIVYNGKTYRSNAIKMTVTAATGNSSSGEPEVETKLKNNKDVFCTIALSKKKVYKGEPLQVTYKLYTRFTQIHDYNLKLGTQKDFWAQEIVPGKQGWPSSEETVNGVRYLVWPLKKEIIIPQRTGTITLEPFDMMVVARVSFVGSQRFDVVSNSPSIEVMPLPANAPASFSNAVGKYKMEASISKNDVKVNDGIDFEMKISGSGNLKLVEVPKPDFPGDFEVYDPETNEKISVSGNGMTGSRDYKYLVIPRNSGKYTIKPVPFTYFDLDSKTYVTLYSPEFKINVQKGEGGQQAGVSTLGAKDEVQILEKEVRHLKKYESLSRGAWYFTGSGLYYAAVGAPVLCYLLLVFIVKRRKDRYDPAQEREKKAGKNVVKQLQKAHQLLAASNTTEFYTELLRGIQSYYCDKFNTETIDFNRQRIQEVLVSKGVSPETTAKFVALVERCEMARYASFMQGNERSTYEEASSVVHEIEKEVKA